MSAMGLRISSMRSVRSGHRRCTLGRLDRQSRAVVTALLFTAGKFAIGYYIGKSGLASAYGAAASIVTILLWIYYASLILLFGAEFTKAYAESRGSRAQ
jgi:uncharacterized BrkB/YihY/UPF0761 family membrane protein